MNVERRCEGAGCPCEHSGECPTAPYDATDALLMDACATLHGRDAWFRHYAYGYIGLSVDEIDEVQ